MKPCFDLLIDIKPHTQTNTRKKRQSRMRKTKPQANMINKFVVFWQTHMSWYLLWLILRQQSKLSSDWSYAHFPFKWPRQEAKTKHKQNKTTFTATRSQKCSPTNCCFFFVFYFGALSQGLCAVGYFALPVVCSSIWLAKTSCPIFLKLDSNTVCLFVKESPIWNYPN